MKRFLIAVSMALSVCNAFATDNIKEVLNQIAKNNLSLKALSHEGEAQVLDIKAENTLNGLSIEYSPFFKSGYSGMAETELTVSQEIQFPTKYAVRNKQAKLEQTIVNQQYESMRRDILLEAENICIDIIRLNQILDMLGQRLDNSNTLRQMFDKRMEAGDANILEVNKVKLDCIEVQSLVTEAHNERTDLLQQLALLNGGESIDITATKMPEFPDITDYESFLALALNSDADIMTAEASLKAAEMEVKVQKKEWLPNITVGYRRNTEEKENLNGMLVGMAFPLYSNSKKVKAARERKESAEIRVIQTRQKREAALKSRYLQYVRMQEMLDHTDVKMMKESLGLYSTALQQGEINALDYYTEINGIYEKLERHIDIHCQSTKLQAELHKNEL